MSASIVPTPTRSRANIQRLEVEPFWFSVAPRRKDGELRVWMTGQTVMTTELGAAASPVQVTARADTKLCEVR